jgi:hypothetical protein
MADPVAATLTQLRNIQAKTGKTIAELHAAVSASGWARHGERRSWLMEQFKLGYGDANAVVHAMGRPLPDLDGSGVAAPPAVGADPLDAIYAGPKAGLRPLHDRLIDTITTFGEFEQAPKKAYVSLRRKKQFAMVGPATKDSIEIGLNAKNLPAHVRLKAQPQGSMCQATTRIANAAEIDKQLVDWLRQAYDNAGP